MFINYNMWSYYTNKEYFNKNIIIAKYPLFCSKIVLKLIIRKNSENKICFYYNDQEVGAVLRKKD